MALLTVAAVLAVAFGVPSCSRGTSPPGPPALVLPSGDGGRFVYHRLKPGTYVAYGMLTATVLEPLRIIGVEPLARTADVDFVSAYVAFYACSRCRRRPGTFGTTVLLGSTCGATDLHARILAPARGLEVFPGDAVHLILVGRFRDGTGSFEGARVTYQIGRRKRTVTSPYHGANVDAAAAPLARPCPDPATELWFGARDKEQTRTRLLD